MITGYGLCFHADSDKNEIDINGCSRKDISTWNSIISGLCTHGSVQHTLQIFSKMIEEGFKPNELTLVCVLSAYSRARPAR